MKNEKPKQIDRYSVQKVLGQGGMGTVYRAHDPMMDRTVAIKTIRLDKLDEGEREVYKTRFFREVRIGGKLNHPNVVVHYDTGELDGRPYLVMEYVEGGPLSDQIKSGELIASNRVIQIIHQIAGALDTAHDMGIIHRDVKPQNIMLMKDDRIKILDFGIARLVESEMTQTGEFLGTPKYCAPEQIVGESVDFRADNFALAVIAHELISGQTPFPGKSFNSILYKIVHEDPEIATYTRAGELTNRVLGTLFRKAFDKNPVKRHGSAGEFAEELERALTLEGRQAHPGQDSPTMALPLAGESHSASQVIKDLEDRLEQELREAREQEQRIRTLRDQFKDGLEARDLPRCKEAYESLVTEKTDTTFERKALDTLESKLAVEEHGRKARRLSEIEDKRRAYRQHVANDDLDGAESQLSALRNLDATVDEELKILREMLAKREKKRRDAQIKTMTIAFDKAMADRQVEDAKNCLLELVHLGGATDAMRQAVVNLERDLWEEKQRHKKQITTCRERFADAMRSRQAKTAARAMQELADLGESVRKEQLALKSLEQELADEHRAREQNIEQYQREFSQAMERREPDAARAALARLQSLDLDGTQEIKAVEALEQSLWEERLAGWHDYFKKSLEGGQFEAARNAIGTLDDLGEDTSALRAELADWEARKQREEENHLQLIERLKQDFRTAIEAQDPVAAEAQLDELKRLNVPFSEASLLPALKRELEREQEERDAAIMQQRDRFRQAVKEEDISAAGQTIDVLKGFQVPIDQEIRTLQNLEKKVRRKAEQREAREIKVMRSDFEKANKQGRIENAQKILADLEQRDVDVTSYRVLLEKTLAARERESRERKAKDRTALDRATKEASRMEDVPAVAPTKEKRKAVPVWVWPTAAALILAVVLIIAMGGNVLQPTVPAIEDDQNAEQLDDGDIENVDDGSQPPVDISPADREPTPSQEIPTESLSGEDNRTPSTNVEPDDPESTSESDLNQPDDTAPPIRSPEIVDDQDREPATIPPNDPPVDLANRERPSENPSENTSEGRGESAQEIVPLQPVEREEERSGETDVPEERSDPSDETSNQDLPPREENNLPAEEPNEPEPVLPTSAPPQWILQLRHETPKDYVLAGRSIDVVLSKQPVPQDKVRDIALHWRAGDNAFSTRDMALKKGKLTGSIPRKGLKEGRFEYYFVVRLDDGTAHQIDNAGKPFLSELKRRKRATGF